MTHGACESKPRSVVRSGTCGRIRSQETGWQSGVLSLLMLPHLVQELKSGTVCEHIYSSNLEGHFWKWRFSPYLLCSEFLDNVVWRVDTYDNDFDIRLNRNSKSI